MSKYISIAILIFICSVVFLFFIGSEVLTQQVHFH